MRVVTRNIQFYCSGLTLYCLHPGHTVLLLCMMGVESARVDRETLQNRRLATYYKLETADRLQ